MKCPSEINDRYFRGELALAEIDCEPWDSNYREPDPEPIDVGGKIVERGDAGRPDTSDTSVDPTTDDPPADKAPCPCTEKNPLLWLLAGLAIGYAMRK